MPVLDTKKIERMLKPKNIEKYRNREARRRGCLWTWG